MIKQKFVALFFAIVVAYTVVVPVPFVEAVSPTDGAVAEIKAELATFSQEVSALRARFAVAAEPGSAEALARLDLLRQFQAKMQTLRTRIADLAAKIPASQKLQKGAVGDEVKALQTLLKQFPDVYPEGLETGTFGPATERAIKKLQEKFGLEQVGNVGPQTRKKFDELERSIHRKQVPKIAAIAPNEISVNTLVTLTGSGFTLENNSLFVKGKTILTGLTSHDGTAIVFSLPADIPCEVGQACPIKIVNSNGISNAKPFKLVEAVPAPDPEPIPESAPEPTPPPPPPPPVPAPVPAPVSTGPIYITPPSTTRVSVASDGAQGNNISSTQAISGDGRYVAFSSIATNFVSGDTNGVSDVFVHDRETKVTTRVSVASDGSQANDESGYFRISADGRYVVFESIATNLVVGDTNGLMDIFIHDREARTTSRISLASDGSQTNNTSDNPSISVDGRFVAFTSNASNLVVGDTNFQQDVFVRDLLTGETSRISVSSNGSQGFGASSFYPAISANGRFVTFLSFSTGLVSDDTNGRGDVFVHDRETKSTTRVSLTSGGLQSVGINGPSQLARPSISSDGRYITFVFEASDLVSNDTNIKSDIFLHDRTTKTTTRISVSSGGAEGNGASVNAAISSGGRYIVFESYSANLIPDDTNSQPDIFVYDRETKRTSRVSISFKGEQGFGAHMFGNPVISADGRYVAFTSSFTNLVSNDSNYKGDIFVHERLFAGVVGTAYRMALTVVNGVAPMRWSVKTGLLPTGLSIDFSSGVISGIPSSTGVAEFTVEVTDGAGAIGSRALVIEVAPAPAPAPSPPPPPAAPTLTSISPSMVTTGMTITLNGSGFTSTNNTVTFTGLFTEPNQVLTGISSADGVTLDVVIPSTMPCKVTTECSVFVTNQNGKSTSITFLLGQHIDPVTVISPNGGERIIQGTGATISASGGKSEALGGAVSIGFYLVQPSATTASDPTDLIVGTIPSGVSGYVWDARRVCEGLTCWDVAPGDYKVLVVGTDTLNRSTIWDSTANTPGNIDVSDAPFTILPAPIPMVSVVSPNGGEAYKYGDAVTITWEAKNIASKLVNIKLLKAGTIVQTIASNVAQSAESGLFIRNWIVPTGLAVGSDYTIEVSDAANSAVKDISDGQFRISNLAALQIYGPNGGETAMRGFSALLFWTYSGYTPATINVNLYKGGVFYRTLASGVKPVGFSGYTFLQASYPTNSRYAEVPIALDIPDGDDYTLEIVDGADLSIRDKSDVPFRIISLPNPVTFKGRLIDAITKEPLANAWFGWAGLPRFNANENGEFSYATTTDDLLAPTKWGKSLFVGGGNCTNVANGSVRRYPDMPRAGIGPGWFTAVAPYYLTLYPLTTSIVDFSSIPLWPTAKQIHTFTDVLAQLRIYHQKEDGTIAGGGGNIGYKLAHTLSYPFPLGFNVRIEFPDQAGNKNVSPFAFFGTDVRCPLAALSFMDGTFQWEPYVVGFYLSGTSGTVGTSYQGVLKTYTSPYYYETGDQGVAPFTWGWVYGSLPPGLSFDAASGSISGTPTTAGTYTFGVKVKDANGVRASRDLFITVR